MVPEPHPDPRVYSYFKPYVVALAQITSYRYTICNYPPLISDRWILLMTFLYTSKCVKTANSLYFIVYKSNINEFSDNEVIDESDLIDCEWLTTINNLYTGKP